MTPTTLFIMVIIAADLGYGLLVYTTNPQRAANKAFLLLTGILALWMYCVWSVLISTTEIQALVWLRGAFMISQLVPTSFHLLRLAIQNPNMHRYRALRMSWPILLINAAIAVMCATDFFVRGIVLPEVQSLGGGVAQPIYGPGFLIFNIYYVLVLGWLVWRYRGDTRRATGIQRSELQFVMLGCGSCIITGISLALVWPAITGNSNTAPLAPICAIVLNAVIAYGIATKRIMGVATILRRVTAYALLIGYLLLLYFAVRLTTEAGCGAAGVAPGIWPELLAALATALSVAPASGRMQAIATRLFVNVHATDVRAIVQRANQAMQSIATTDDLLKQFSKLVSDSMGAENPCVYLSQNSGFVRAYPLDPADTPRTMAHDAPIARALRLTNSPLILESLRRRRLSPLLTAATDAMITEGAAAAIGIKAKGRLTGIMLLGPRVSGHVYGRGEEEALQVICSDLAVAIDNARLFTETRNSRIYNDILLDSLGSGVIAADGEGTITAFNRDAQRMLGFAAHEIIGSKVDALPPSLARIIKETFDSGLRRQEEEVTLRQPTGNTIHLRTSGSVFHSHTGDPLGALIVLHDITRLKALQNQIRRSDRLASMGTLSAGMAHEIKNPLVTIKTFTQLLPERYEESDFRESFVSLVSEEVKRIDSLVNQLLTFARPSKPTFEPIRMHDVIIDSLRLVGQKLEQHNIETTCDFQCTDDAISGDADLLSQAYVNLFLNAADAMGDSGTLSVTTSLIQNSRTTRERPGHRGHMMAIRITDTGQGIKEADLPHVFDPFFTTKSSGTGLGLAVSHGIIDEQGGIIDVESTVGKGTSFLIEFPLTRNKGLE